jgi:CubicO group peptidase (beta-lactamase class C family)
MLLLSHGTRASSDSTISKIDALFADFNRSNAPGASVTVIQNGKVLLAKGYGLANVEEKIPCAPKTNFRLADAREAK